MVSNKLCRKYGASGFLDSVGKPKKKVQQEQAHSQLMKIEMRHKILFFFFEKILRGSYYNSIFRVPGLRRRNDSAVNFGSGCEGNKINGLDDKTEKSGAGEAARFSAAAAVGTTAVVVVGAGAGATGEAKVCKGTDKSSTMAGYVAYLTRIFLKKKQKF
jgi:hypothetical protein